MDKGTVILAVAVLLPLAMGWWWLHARRSSGGASGRLDPDRIEPLAELPRDYSPRNVGNDASARPWEASPSTFGDEPDPQEALASAGGAAPGGFAPPLLPAGFDVADFLRASKENFIRLQAAWDQADIPTLRALMTHEMSEQIQTQLSARETQGAQNAAPSEVMMLEAKLLGIEHLAQGLLASVEFSGLIREESGTGPNPFREVWSITRPQAGQGDWLVAGVQALQ
ncbi:MAG TPA: Tim44-like domain-containing protein [Macromonas sp.]|nr:Tim44-like domain-containing protein [Macromonas sp.]